MTKREAELDKLQKRILDWDSGLPIENLQQSKTNRQSDTVDPLTALRF